MANVELGSPRGVVDRRRSAAGSAGIASATHLDAEKANYVDVGGMRTRLAAINGAYFTTARLDAMTVNDMVYAIRVHGTDNGASIK